ncbi:MAG: DUF494 family protein [Candidatus Zixiibacteriota bacterium]
MDERLLDIVVYMVSRLRGASAPNRPFHKLANDLQTMGFSDHEISSAYSWMFDRWGGKQDSVVPDSPQSMSSLRVLSPRERVALSAEATGYLLRLVELGILKLIDFEEIVEACVQSGRNSVTIDEMKVIVSGALFAPAQTLPVGHSDLSFSHHESRLVN